MLSSLWMSIRACLGFDDPSTSHQWPQPADDDQGYQRLGSMPQLPWSTFQPADDNRGQQQLRSMPQLPWSVFPADDMKHQSIEEQSNNVIIVKSVTYVGERRGSSLCLVGAKAEIHVRKPYAALQWGHARVERLVLEEGGKEALETFRTKGLTKEELRALYPSILKMEEERYDWSVDDLWRHIMRRKKKAGLSDLFDEKDLDRIKLLSCSAKQ